MMRLRSYITRRRIIFSAGILGIAVLAYTAIRLLLGGPNSPEYISQLDRTVPTDPDHTQIVETAVIESLATLSVERTPIPIDEIPSTIPQML